MRHLGTVVAAALLLVGYGSSADFGGSDQRTDSMY